MHTKNRGFRRLGKDVISRFTLSKFSKLKKSAFYTDTNSLGFIERKREPRPLDPIPSQYFPITSQAFIKSEENQFSITLDRSAGAASLKTNQIEVMLHRRGMSDDNKGLVRPINDESETSGKIYINYENLSKLQLSKLEKQVTHIPKVVSSFTSLQQTTSLTGIIQISCKTGKTSCMLIDGHCLSTTFDLMSKCSILKNKLPGSLHLLSLKRDQFLNNMLIMRFQNMDEEEDIILKSLDNYFNFKKKIVNIVGVNLAANDGELSEDLEFPVKIDKGQIISLRIYLE